MILLIHARAFSCTVKTLGVAFVVAINPRLITCFQTVQHCNDAGAVACLCLFGLAVVAELVLGTLGASVETVIVTRAIINTGEVIVKALKEIISVFDTLIENYIAGF